MKKGYDENVANEIYDLIVRFANYGFNRSHAVAYSMIAYQLAYLKSTLSRLFYGSAFASVIGNENKIAQYIQKQNKWILLFFLPLLITVVFPFLVEKGGIRYSLAAIKGVGAWH